ncbi:MAG: hypothetical protein ABR549_18115 [Mycobacteriales bacterium]
MTACRRRLTSEGCRQQVGYQAASSFWPLQWLELAFYLALSALLTLVTFRWVRRVS